jgi:hypothetical protein
MSLSPASIADVNARADLGALAQEFGATLRRSPRGLVGACPLCGGGKRATRFEIKGAAWMCAVCAQGGDAIALVRACTGRDFRGAVEFLGGARALSPDEERRLEDKRRREEARREALAEGYRAKEIAAARRIWEGDRPTLCDPASLDAYLGARGVARPRSAQLRLAADLPYFHGETVDEHGRAEPILLWRGPAMIAAATDSGGVFRAAHITWLSPDCRAKLTLADPESGEILPAKKVRGAKQGAKIVLRDGGATPRRLFLGEGIETVLSVATALRRAGRLGRADAFWSSVDLGNLGGPHEGTVAHPEAKSAAGRALRVPSDIPAEGPAIVIPDSVEELVLLGDGDSDPFLTGMTLRRGARRYARPGRVVRIAMAPSGADFNDVLRGDAA